MMTRFKKKIREVMWEYLKDQKNAAEKELELKRAEAAQKLAES